MKIGIFSGTQLEVYGGTEIWSLYVGNWLVKRGYDVYFIAPKEPISKDTERMKVSPEFKYYRVPFDIIKVGPLRAYRPRYYPKVDLKYLANLGVFPIADDATVVGGHTLTPGVELNTLRMIPLTLLVIGGKLKKAHALTKSQARAFANMGFRRIYLIPNGVDCIKYKVKEVKKPTVVFIGRLTPQKGVPRLIEIAYALREVEFNVIGDGPLRDMVIKAARRSGNIIFHGFVSEEDKVRILSEASIFILPSLYEIMPLSILEAAASGLLVIASDIPYIREINVYKILCKNDDIECFIKAIKENITRINIHYKRRVREKVMKYCWDNVLPNIEQMFIEVYEEHAHKRGGLTSSPS